MPWSGGSFTRTNGVHTGSTLWVQDRDAGTKILATRHDTHDQDLAEGINATLEKSGSNAATGNLDIGSNRITLVADGTAKTDAATVNQIQSNAPAFQATDTGTANAHVIALSPAITAYAAGQAVTFKSASASTTASTLNVNGLGTKALKKKNDQAIAAGDIESGSIVTVVYDGTNFQVTSQLGSEASAGGSNTQVQYNSSGSLAGDADLTFDGTNLTVANPLYLPDGAVATPAIANTGDLNTGVYFPAADTVGVTAGGVEKWRFGSNPLPGRNLVINGAMNVAQRGTSVTGAGVASGTLVQDQWIHMNDAGTWRYTVTQTADGPVGFANCLKIDCTTADTSLAANVLQRIETRLEAQNLQHLAFGNAAAKTVTLSFYVKCTSTGTMSVLLQQQDGGRSYHQNYTIDSTDTWERKTLVFSGDASGGMDDDNGIGFSIYWTLASGTDFQGGTSGSWTAHNNNLYGTSGDLNVFGSTATNWFMTGVQLEVGGIATDFEHEDFGTTLRKCQRYYERLNMNNTGSQTFAIALNQATTVAAATLDYVTKRAFPTVTFTAAATFEVLYNSSGSLTATDATAITAAQIGINTTQIQATLGSGLTLGEASAIRRDGTDTTYVEFSAEL
jgi:hypothetical protein